VTPLVVPAEPVAVPHCPCCPHAADATAPRSLRLRLETNRPVLRLGGPPPQLGEVTFQ